MATIEEDTVTLYQLVAKEIIEDILSPKTKRNHELIVS